MGFSVSQAKKELALTENVQEVQAALESLLSVGNSGSSNNILLTFVVNRNDRKRGRKEQEFHRVRYEDSSTSAGPSRPTTAATKISASECVLEGEGSSC
jgi:hypothetical protein